MIKHHEGWRSKPYEDTEGILTIGYGFNIAQGITREEGEAILDVKLRKLIANAGIRLSLYDSVDSTRQIILLDMAYNLGFSRLLKFKRMWKAIKIKDWNKAAEEMLDSRWARQVKGRAIKLAEAMRTGKFNKED